MNIENMYMGLKRIFLVFFYIYIYNDFFDLINRGRLLFFLKRMNYYSIFDLVEVNLNVELGLNFRNKKS